MDEEKKDLTTAEARLHLVEQERKALRAQVKDERTTRLEEAAKMREERDEKIEEIQEKLKEISEEIYTYNKLGKVAKIECNILDIIAKIGVIQVNVKIEGGKNNGRS